MADFTKKHYETVAHVLKTNLMRYEYDSAEHNTGNDDDDVNEIYATALARGAVKDIALDLHNVFRVDNPEHVV